MAENEREWREELFELAERQNGAVGLFQVTNLAESIDVRLHELNGPCWRVPYPSVRVRKGAPRTPELRASAAVLQMGPGAGLGFDSAAAWWGLPGFRLEPVHVLRPRGASTCRKTCGIRFRETRRLPEHHMTILKGINVVRPERLPFELIQNYGPEKVEVLIDRILQRRLTTTGRLHQMLDELGGRGAKGIGELRRLMKARPAGYVPPESGAESRMKWVAERFGLPGMRPQVNLGSDTEWIARVDFVIGDRIVLWVQSDLYHSALVDKRKDADQRAKLEDQGMVVIEAWQHELWDNPEAIAQRVLQTVATTKNPRTVRDIWDESPDYL